MSGEGISIDLEGAVDPFAAADAGEYDLEITDVSTEPSKSGAAMVTFETQIIGHELYAGKNIWEYCTLEGKGKKFGIWKLRSICEACGVDMAGIKTVGDINPDDFKGKSFRARVGKKPPQGEYKEGNTIEEVIL